MEGIPVIFNRKLDNEIVNKIWGKEEIVVNNELYCSKFLHLKKDFKCSYHCHKIKTETFYVLSGSVLMKYGSEKNYSYKELEKGDSMLVLPGLYHSFIGLEDAIILEVSTQDFKDDSYRLDSSSNIFQGE